MAVTHYRSGYCPNGNVYSAGTTRSYSAFRSGFKHGEDDKNWRQEGTSKTRDVSNNIEGCRTTGSTSGRTYVVKKYDTYKKDSTYTLTDGRDDNDVPITVTSTRQKRCESSRAVTQYDDGQNRETHTYNDANGNAQEKVEKTLYGEEGGQCTPKEYGIKFNVAINWFPDWSHYLDPYAQSKKLVTTRGECHELLTTKQPDSNNTKFYIKYGSRTVEPCPSTEFEPAPEYVDSATRATYSLGSISGCVHTCRTNIGYGNDVVIKIRGETKNEERKEFRSLMFETYMHGPTGFIYETCGPTTGDREPATFKEFFFLSAGQRATNNASYTEYTFMAPFGDEFHPDTVEKTKIQRCVYRGQVLQFPQFTTPDVDYGQTVTDTSFYIVNDVSKTSRVYDWKGKSHELQRTTISQGSFTYTYYSTSAKSWNTEVDVEVKDEEGEVLYTAWAEPEAASIRGIDIWKEVRTTLFRIKHKGLIHDIVNWGEDGFIDTPATVALTVPLPAMTGNRNITLCQGNYISPQKGPTLYPCGVSGDTTGYNQGSTTYRREVGQKYVPVNGYNKYRHILEQELNEVDGGQVKFFAYEAKEFYTTGFQRISDVGRDGIKWNKMSTPLDLRVSQTLSAAPDLTAFRTIVSDIGYSAPTTTEDEDKNTLNTFEVDNSPLTKSIIIGTNMSKKSAVILKFHSEMTALSFGVSNNLTYTNFDCTLSTFETNDIRGRKTTAYSFLREVNTTGTRRLEDRPQGSAVLHHHFHEINVDKHFAVGGLDQNGEYRTFFLCAHFIGTAVSATLQGTFHRDCESYTTELALGKDVKTVKGKVPTVYRSDQMIAVSDAINMLNNTTSMIVDRENVSNYI